MTFSSRDFCNVGPLAQFIFSNNTTYNYTYYTMSSSSGFPYINGNYGNFNFSFDDPERPEPPKTSHTLNALPELLKRPCVMDLFRQNQALQSSQIKLQEKSFALHDKNLALQSEVLSLESELNVTKQKVHSLSTELQSLQVNTNM